MPRATVGQIELEYDTFGEREGPALLLVMGLGAQMLSWDEDFCEALASRGFFVIRFDNRDVGLSTKVDAPAIDIVAVVVASMSGAKVEAPYLLGDMASDAWGLLDTLSIERAHIVGASLGGMIVQTMAIQHPERVLSLTSIMSNTGDFEYGAPKPEVALVLLDNGPADREAYIEHSVEVSRLIGSPEHFDEDRVRRRHGRTFDRCYYPRGIGHQLLAVLASGSRDDQLRTLDIPSLVLHGTEDPLITPSGGEHTAECLPGSELVMLEGMGHDLPVHYWPRVIDRICAVAARAQYPSEV
jgi:pimeloyl-ACP methyl ester carboxylesterase